MMSKTSWSGDGKRNLGAMPSQLESEGTKLESSLDQPASSKEELFEHGIRMIRRAKGLSRMSTKF